MIPEDLDCTGLKVYNCLGQRVFETDRPPDGLVRWYGKDLSGRPLPAGVYFCRAVGGGPSRTAKVVLVR